MSKNPDKIVRDARAEADAAEHRAYLASVESAVADLKLTRALYAVEAAEQRVAILRAIVADGA